MPWTSPHGERPPDPDHVAPRGTAAYNDAVQRLHAWVAKNYARGVPLDQLVDKYDDMGNTSHDWKQWTGQMEGTESAIPMEYQQELWNIGNFQKHQSKQEADGGWWGDYTKDPTSGMYFNDPGNDPSKRMWYDEFGDIAPNAPQNNPEVEYGPNGRIYFVDRKKELLAKPGEQTVTPGQTSPMGVPSPGQQASPLMNRPMRPTNSRPTTAWGGSPVSYGGAHARTPMAPQQMGGGFDSFGSQTRRPMQPKAGFSRGFY